MTPHNVSKEFEFEGKIYSFSDPLPRAGKQKIAELEAQLIDNYDKNVSKVSDYGNEDQFGEIGLTRTIAFSSSSPESVIRFAMSNADLILNAGTVIMNNYGSLSQASFTKPEDQIAADLEILKAQAEKESKGWVARYKAARTTAVAKAKADFAAYQKAAIAAELAAKQAAEDEASFFKELV